MRTLKITLPYDGTDYVGWQRQAAGTSIQGLLEDALAPIAGARVTVARRRTYGRRRPRAGAGGERHAFLPRSNQPCSPAR